MVKRHLDTASNTHPGTIKWPAICYLRLYMILFFSDLRAVKSSVRAGSSRSKMQPTGCADLQAARWGSEGSRNQSAAAMPPAWQFRVRDSHDQASIAIPRRPARVDSSRFTAMARALQSKTIDPARTKLDPMRDVSLDRARFIASRRDPVPSAVRKTCTPESARGYSYGPRQRLRPGLGPSTRGRVRAVPFPP